MRNPLRVPAATLNGLVGTRIGRGPGYVHSGVDIGVVVGTAVYAARQGTIAYAGYNRGSGYGNFVVIDHGNGIYSAYAHLDSLSMVNADGTVRALSSGDPVTSDTIIGLSGRTTGYGTSSATDPRSLPPHLHFEIRRINGSVQTITDAAGVEKPTIVSADGVNRGEWPSRGNAYFEALRNPDAPGGQILYDPQEIVRLYGADLSPSIADTQERFLRIRDPYGRRDLDGMGGELFPGSPPQPGPFCFVAGTPVLMADGSHKPIEQIAADDEVAAFDPAVNGGHGPLVSGRVTRTFRNQAFTFSFLNLRTTPGHRFLTGEGGFERLDSILENDGTVVSQIGEVVRARTGFLVGTPEDGLARVLYEDRKGRTHEMLMRGGMVCDDQMVDGRRALLTIYKAMEQRGLRLRDDGLFEAADGSTGSAMWDGVPGDHLQMGRHIPFARLLKLHREKTPLLGLLGGRRAPNPVAEAMGLPPMEGYASAYRSAPVSG
jgi:hypothetical protein